MKKESSWSILLSPPQTFSRPINVVRSTFKLKNSNSMKSASLFVFKILGFLRIFFHANSYRWENRRIYDDESCFMSFIRTTMKSPSQIRVPNFTIDPSKADWRQRKLLSIHSSDFILWMFISMFLTKKLLHNFCNDHHD